MRGNICILGDSGWAVSNDAVLDHHKERVSTADGDRMITYGVFDVSKQFVDGDVSGDVKVSFQAEDGKNVSYMGTVTRSSETKYWIKIKGQINEYKQILERTLSWHKA